MPEETLEKNEEQEYSYELKIPKERIAVLIGKKGEVKKEIEQRTKIHVDINSTEGDVVITGKDPLNLYSAREVVRAIGRGFNPDIAILLLKQDYGLELINIQLYAKTKNDAQRLKGRIIGEEGKARNTIEELTNTHIVVYGKTVAIVGEYEGITAARKAIESLLSGSPHSHVYKFLEKRRKVLRITGF